MMSRPVRERLRELEADVQHLQVRPAADIRARGRSRGRRQAAAVVAAGVAVVATTGIALTWPHQRVNPTGDRPAVSCVLALPDDPAEVRIQVFGGGADTVAAQLRARRFSVQIAAIHPGPVTGAAALRYGPAAIGAATVVRAEVHGAVAMRFDPGRPDATVDLTVGPAFTRLATATEVNRDLALAGEPSAPPECR
jgi:hypothetical protein